MQETYSFVQSMNSAEKRIVRSYFSAFSSRKETSPLFLKLFDYLCRCKTEPTDEEVCGHLYSKPNTGYRMLKSRFRSKMLDALNLDVNIDRKETLDEVSYVSVTARKKLSQFLQLYFTRGNHPAAIQLLNNVITLAGDYELYSVLSEALSFKKYFRAMVNNLGDLKKLNEQIADADYSNMAVLKALDYYNQIIRWDTFYPELKQQKQITFLESCIIDLKNDYQITRSASVNYYLKMLEVFYYDLQTEYAAAKDACAELFDTLCKHKAVFRRQRIGFALDNMGHYDIYMSNYMPAIENFRKAQQYFPAFSNNYYLSREQEFLALFYAGKFDEAEKVCKQLLKAPALTHGGFNLAKYKFYYANVLFKQQNYKGALKQLAQEFAISSDKTGWEVSLRLLNIMCNIELERTDVAELHVNNLRKHIEHNKDAEFIPRDKLSVRVLSGFARNGFSRHAVNHNFYNSLRLLAGNEKQYQWKVLTPELIPFHTWMADKLHYKLPEPAKQTVTNLRVVTRRVTKRKVLVRI